MNFNPGICLSSLKKKCAEETLARCAREIRKNHVDPAGVLKGGCVGMLRPQAANVLTEMDREGSVHLRMWEEQRKQVGGHDGQPGAWKERNRVRAGRW